VGLRAAAAQLLSSPRGCARASTRARNHVHRREPLYIRLAVLREPDRQPMLPRLDEHAAPTAWWSIDDVQFGLARCSTRAARLGTGRRQVRSHTQRPASVNYQGLIGQLQSLAPSNATECTLIVCVRRSLPLGEPVGALESRCAAAAMDADLARLPRARIKGSSGRQVVSAAALAAKAIGGPQVALGRAGDGPRAFPSWVGGGLGAASVALCGARGDDLRAADFSAPTPLRWAASPRSSG
jgi:hypothetical protein